MITRSTPDTRAYRAGWFVPFAALALIWGSSFLFIGIGVRELHPLYVTLGRVATGALTLLVFLAITRTALPRDPRLWGHLVVVATVGVALPFSLFGFGEQRVSSVLAGIWNATTPLVALPLAALVFRTERITARRAAGIGLGFAGVLVVLGVWHGIGGAQLTGQLMCFAAAACYGVAIPYQKRFVAGRPESGLAISAAQLIMGTVLLAIVTPLTAGAPPALGGLSGKAIASVLALGALGTGLAFVLNFRVIRLAGASTSASVTYLMPVVATLLGVIALDEHVSWYQPAGAALILLGVAVSQGVLRRRARTTTVGLPPESAAAAQPVATS